MKSQKTVFRFYAKELMKGNKPKFPRKIKKKYFGKRIKMKYSSSSFYAKTYTKYLLSINEFSFSDILKYK